MAIPDSQSSLRRRPASDGRRKRCSLRNSGDRTSRPPIADKQDNRSARDSASIEVTVSDLTVIPRRSCSTRTLPRNGGVGTVLATETLAPGIAKSCHRRGSAAGKVVPQAGLLRRCRTGGHRDVASQDVLSV